MNGLQFLKIAAVLVAIVAALYGRPANAAGPQPVTISVVYHSATSNTEKTAQGVAEGAVLCACGLQAPAYKAGG